MKHSTTWLAIAITVLLTIAKAGHGQPLTSSPPPSRIAMGYYLASVEFPLTEVPWHQLTHLAHAYLELDEKGEIAVTDGLPSSELVAAAHQREVRVMLSLGGRQSVGRFEAISSDPARRGKYVQDVLAIVQEHGYDGVDVDWLSPRSEESGQHFGQLIRQFRQGLDALAARLGDGRKYQLSAAVSAGAQAHFGQWVDGQVLAENCDFINVQAYDLAGPWSRYAGHHAPLLPSPGDPERRWRNVKYVVDYWNRRKGIPKKQLCIGIACFGRSFPAQRPFVALDTDLRERHAVIPFTHLRTLIDEGWAARWDHDAHVPWLFAPAANEVVAYDDRNSVFRKATWAREEKLGGMYFFAIHQDRMPDQTNWLIGAAIRAWPR